MLRVIGLYGLIGGLIVAIPMVALMVGAGPSTFMAGGLLYGYLSMLIALTTVFLGIKHYRDKVSGGVIRFLPALGMGLGISFVASLIYALGWELSLALTGFDFGEFYGKAMLDAARAKGLTGTELQKAASDAESFTTTYRDPLFRIPMSFIEIFPVGVLISLISAGLLRNSRFLPARAQE